jgi:phage FluMu gp28-like protein
MPKKSDLLTSTPLTEGSPLPELLLQYQAEAIRLATIHDFLVIEKSRRIGISYGFSPYATLAAAAALAGTNVYYVGYNLDMAREFIGYCADFTKAFDGVTVALPPPDAILESMTETKVGPEQVVTSGNVSIDSAEGTFLFHDGSTKGIKTLRVDFPNGKAIAALPSTPRAVRGKQGIFIIDEAAFHDDLDGLIKAVLAALMWGGKVIVISTHDGDDNAFNQLVQDIRSKRRAGHVMRITLRDALDQGLYKRICLVGGKEWSEELEEKWEADLRHTYGDAADEELDVIPARGSGTYLARATIEAAMSPLYPVLRLSCPNGFERNDLEWRTDWVQEWLETEIAPLLRKLDLSKYCYFGQDFARSSDLSAIAIGQYDEMATLICHFIIEMRNVPSREQEQVLEFIIDGMPLFAAGKMDGRGNGFGMAEAMQDKYGEEAIELVMATPKTYLEMMPRLKARIEDRQLVIPRSDGVVEDLRCIKLVKGVPTIVDRTKDKEDGAKGKRHGDTAIALMHLVAAADEDTGPIEFHRGEQRATSDIGGDMIETAHGSVRTNYDDGFSL